MGLLLSCLWGALALSFHVTAMDGINRTKERGILFLHSNPTDKFINAFDAQIATSPLKRKTRRHLREIADSYLGGFKNPKKHHGWDKGEQYGRYVDCYVFKPPPSSRIYGFLLHPKWDMRFEIFVMVHQTKKYVDDTDFTILNGVLRLRERSEVREIVNSYMF